MIGLPQSFFHPFVPRLLRELHDYNRGRLASDLGAGITVGIVALPLAMAFGIASGVTPQAGIFTAIIAGFLISALGGSKVQIGGPAGAFIVIIAGIIDRYGLANLLIATIMAGVLLFAMGLFKLGSLIRFIPVSIVIGFTNGIAVLIALSQVKDFLGLTITKFPADFFGQLAALRTALPGFNVTAFTIGCICLALMFLWPKLVTSSRALQRVPASIIVLVLATLAVSLGNLPVETIGSRFGELPDGLPAFALPEFSWDTARNLVAPTLTIALLGAIESLLCARVADQMIDDRHDPNQELMAQGIANVVTPFFGGIPATGTIARTTTNVRSGATSPIAGLVHAAILLLIVLVGASLAKHVPLVALAAILLFVAWNMGEWREFARLKQFNLTYRTIMLATFFSTVVFDLTVAVEVGLVLACLFFIYRMSSLTSIARVMDDTLPHGTSRRDGVVAYRLFGSLFFGTVGKLEALMESDAAPRVMVLDLHQVVSIDTTGLDALESIQRGLAKRGAHLVLCDLNAQPISLVRRSGFATRLGAQNVCATLAEAILRAEQLASAKS